MTTEYKTAFFEGLICWSYENYVNHICNSQKQLAVNKRPLKAIKVFQILFLKVCNVSCNFSIVETLYRYLESHFKHRWCTKNLKLVSAIFLKFIIHLRWNYNNKQCLPVFALPENQNFMSPWLTLPYIYCFRLSEASSFHRKKI